LYDKPYDEVILSTPTGNPTKFAVIVSGGKPGGEGEFEFRQTAKHIYIKLLNNGYTDETIVYLNAPGTHIIEGSERVDGISCQQNLERVIDWLSKNADSTDNILICIIDHGEFPIFYMTNIQLNAWNRIWRSELADILDNPNLKYSTLTCVLDACFSGCFITKISGPNRIILTASNEYRFSWGWEGYECWFSYYLFNSLDDGNSYRKAFQDAVEGVDYMNDYHGKNQKPLLDDNGDGVGHQYIPEGGDGVDNGLSYSTYL
jgi:hypothetical protein